VRVAGPDGLTASQCDAVKHERAPTILARSGSFPAGCGMLFVEESPRWRDTEKKLAPR
jgi:hypothetical protein